MKEKIYNVMPIFIQNLTCTLKGSIEKNRRLGGNFPKYYQQLLKSQFLSEQEINDFQVNKLKNVLIYCNENIPYYQKIFKKLNFIPEDVTSIKDLEKLPILTKEDVRNNYEELINPNFNDKVLHSHTSGSTGKSLKFLFSEDAVQYRWALWFRHKHRFGIEPNDAYATFTGLAAIPLNQKRPPYWRENYAMKQTIFTMHHINRDTVPYIVERLNKGGFKYYSGYPSILYNLAVIIDDLGLEMKRPPKVIFTGAEALLDYQREKISNVFNCLVTDQYGFSEGCGNASRCEHDLFHEDFEYGILECHKPIANSDGTYTGDVLATGFTNLAMPFIRYQVGDTATWIDKKCECGRESKAIIQVNGRNEDYVITPEGNKILRFDYIFKDTDSVFESQIVQKKLGEIVIRIVKRNNYTDKDEKNITHLVHSKISPNLKVFYEYVSEIEREATGKFRAVKSYIK
ncbi:MAG: phenylacetate--CoA ligase family protein [Flavobacterium sp.]